MKKIALVVAMLLVFGAGHAFAAFDTTNHTLMMSVYNNTSATGDTEYGFNTGIDLSAINWSASFTQSVQTGLTLAPFASTTQWSDLQVGVYGIDLAAGSTTLGKMYFASTDPNDHPNGSAYGNMRIATNNIRANYASVANGGNVALLPNNLNGNSYDVLMNGTVTPGNFNAFNQNNAPSGEANLGVWGDSDPNNNVITMYLVGYNRGNAISSNPSNYLLTNGLLPGVNYVAKVTLDSTGLLTLSNVLPTPIPGAIWLLGSGLLGLLGLRRKNA